MKRTLLTLLLISCFFSLAGGSEKFSWRTDIHRAFQEAKQSSRLVFVDVYADWCEWCHKLDKEVYTDPAFQQFMNGYVGLKVNAEDNKKGTEFAEKYKVEGFPALLVTDSNGVVLNRISGFVTTKELIQELTIVQDLLTAEQKNPNDVRIQLELGKEYLSREMFAECEIRFEKVLSSPAASVSQQEFAQFSLGLSQYYRKDLEHSLSSLEKYNQTYKTGESREDALLLLSQVLIELDSNDKARAILKDFLVEYPQSGNTARARQVLTLLEKDPPQIESIGPFLSLLVNKEPNHPCLPILRRRYLIHNGIS